MLAAGSVFERIRRHVPRPTLQPDTFEQATHVSADPRIEIEIVGVRLAGLSELAFQAVSIMPVQILHFADSLTLGCGANVRFENGEPCMLSIAQSGVRVKKSRFGLIGAVLYDEKNAYINAQRTGALAYLFPKSYSPMEFQIPVSEHSSMPFCIATTLPRFAQRSTEPLSWLKSERDASLTKYPSRVFRNGRIRPTKSQKHLRQLMKSCQSMARCSKDIRFRSWTLRCCPFQKNR
jgi:hypothetical protein